MCQPGKTDLSLPKTYDSSSIQSTKSSLSRNHITEYIQGQNSGKPRKTRSRRGFPCSTCRSRKKKCDRDPTVATSNLECIKQSSTERNTVPSDYVELVEQEGYHNHRFSRKEGDIDSGPDLHMNRSDGSFGSTFGEESPAFSPGSFDSFPAAQPGWYKYSTGDTVNGYDGSMGYHHSPSGSSGKASDLRQNAHYEKGVDMVRGISLEDVLGQIGSPDVNLSPISDFARGIGEGHEASERRNTAPGDQIRSPDGDA
ncbi:uncharacterized protein I206_100510 [Kwoniella pini CBS 10737]|uniref:Zn(2)-C6 fungal-type domain-containing protein n=1 Tax=Kwoniella pini CBS 10737 TaxID=1296096 RepID=A0A1B9ID25_9TREE|nr:uncharacterized protein I206_00817 [Kwoniella pini CBS 10737]OCF53512.1 hypothetical protein I206_00817 [Kwoniella pini CBS 10737]